ncbi:hypothetical protein [Bosea sp. (in: a-proteobacteria)]|uniref:hypothetical protein n=1 Tax=Bosea sp. (in: a-proteobacteria) TaxID=1871050 RepID=UPI00262F4BF0|nr:hypothetical protein [Bosea sp. (in: a-proteobacteria)]MCO5092216.1 hypothetical protein [Bosea sp. (in: a-proteobacteria)]
MTARQDPAQDLKGSGVGNRLEILAPEVVIALRSATGCRAIAKPAAARILLSWDHAVQD